MKGTAMGLIGLVLGTSVAGAAGLPFGFECYKAKDDIAKAKPSASALTALPGFAGGLSDTCVAKVPPKLVCLPSAPILSPAPGPFAAQEEDLPVLCYNVKCTGAVPSPFHVSDQAGAHSLTPSKAKLLCIPACLLPPVACAYDDQCCSGTCCGGACADTSSDPNNCGGCGNVCPPANPACINSVCSPIP